MIELVAKLKRAPLGVLFLFLVAWAPWVQAHPMDEWFTELRWTTGQGLSGRFRVPADQRAKLASLPIVFSSGSTPLEAVWSDAGNDENGRVLVDVKVASSQPLQELTMALPRGLLDQNQSLVGFLSFDGGDPTTVLVGAGGSKTIQVPPASASPVADSSGADLGVFFRFGLKHILEGWDHLLFLFCLLIAGGTLRHLVVVVSAFTVGHSITLALSVLGYVNLPSRLTESMIAFSIIVAALSNLWIRLDDDAETGRRTAISRGAMALGFGLIHGLGFAAMLLQNGLSGTGVIAPLLGFNLGVEAGQVGVVLIFYPFIWAIHRSRHRRTIVVVCSVLAACCGLFWLLERLGVISFNG